MLLECDYLVIGSGASGMAFVDELIHRNGHATVIIVDKHSKPGGHWNDAYDFVTLHQPAAFYGVNSKQLGKGGNALATHKEISAYYEDVMNDFLDGGRVMFFPQCEYKGDGEFRSLLENSLEYKVNVKKKIVDATYVGPSVPSTRKPEFGVAEHVNFVPVNGLLHTTFPWEKYVIIGGGKTGIDAVLFLLNNSVKPERIIWIVPNDYWLYNRQFLFPDTIAEGGMKAYDCILECDSQEELYKRWESIGYVTRIDVLIEPKRFKAGTVSKEEMCKLRLVTNIVRRGRIEHIETNRIVFKGGSDMEMDGNTLYVDCSANGAAPYVPKKIFDGKHVTLQSVRLDQDTYSASVIAAYECRFPDNEDRKNKALKPVLHPQTPTDFIAGELQSLINDNEIGKDIGIYWLRSSRLNWAHHITLYWFVRLLIWAMKYGQRVTERLQIIVDKAESAQFNF